MTKWQISSDEPSENYQLHLQHIYSRNELVNIVEQIAAKDPDISLLRWWCPNTEHKEREHCCISKFANKFNIITFKVDKSVFTSTPQKIC